MGKINKDSKRLQRVLLTLRYGNDPDAYPPGRDECGIRSLLNFFQDLMSEPGEADRGYDGGIYGNQYRLEEELERYNDTAINMHLKAIRDISYNILCRAKDIDECHDCLSEEQALGEAAEKL